MIDGRGWPHSFDSHCTRHSGVGQEIVEKGNHFNDPEAALRETAGVAKAGAPVVVAHEMPDFLAFGHRLGLPGLDRWIASRLMNMGDDFAGLIERHRNIDIAGIGRRLLNDYRYEIIWRGGGYLMVGNAP